MKKIAPLILFLLFSLLLMTKRAGAYTIRLGTCNAYDSCTNVSFYVQTDSLYPSHIETSYGDGTKDTVIIPGGASSISFIHIYSLGGKYTVKHVLFMGSIRTDSTNYSVTHSDCSYLSGNTYRDINNNCVFDAGDKYAWNTMLEVDSSSIPIDTITAWGHYVYRSNRSTGVPYAFKFLSNISGFTPSCPTTGIVTTTTSASSLVAIPDMGFECPSGTGFDVAVKKVRIACGKRDGLIEVALTNTTCNVQNGSLEITIDPKYFIWSSYSTFNPWVSGVVSGNTVSWNFADLFAGETYNYQVNVSMADTPSVTGLTVGDTFMTVINTPIISGDGDTTNNHIVSIDTIKASFDPNEKTVEPNGDVAAGTRLTYTIAFENTGNAPAQNIHIMDTLSPNVDEKTLQIISASYTPDVQLYKTSGLNIIKFDFPGINLLDSSHHGQCDGFVSYSVTAKNTLPVGSKIDNRAGIYFDANEVVMTNTTENVIAPLAVPNLKGNMNVILYPNPATNELRIKASQLFQRITIVNTLGEMLMQKNLQANETNVDVHMLIPGVYYLMIQNKDGVRPMKFEKL